MAVVMRKDLFNAIQAMCQTANLKLASVSPGLTRLPLG